VFNFSRGGFTFSRVQDELNVINWAKLRPEQTIFHVGSVDLASMNITTYNNMAFKTHWFFTRIVETVNYFKNEALQWALNAEDRAFIHNYKFIFSYLADWGTTFIPRVGCMNADDLRGARNANNRFVRARARTLYVEHNVILVCFNHDVMGNFVPARLGVHLVGHSLDNFVAHVKRVIARKFCVRCAVRNWPNTNTRANFALWLRYLTSGRACDQLHQDPEPVLQ
ncbi:unnamed protein product, partial [Meganyctiphanes norvegica]